jgi:hypothetical protein
MALFILCVLSSLLFLLLSQLLHGAFVDAKVVREDEAGNQESGSTHDKPVLKSVGPVGNNWCGITWKKKGGKRLDVQRQYQTKQTKCITNLGNSGSSVGTGGWSANRGISDLAELGNHKIRNVVLFMLNNNNNKNAKGSTEQTGKQANRQIYLNDNALWFILKVERFGEKVDIGLGSRVNSIQRIA